MVKSWNGMVFGRAISAGSGFMVGSVRALRGIRLATPAPFKNSASEVIVARQGLPPLSGLITSRRWVTPGVTVQSSRSKVVPGGLKLYSCRSTSR